MKSKTHGRPGDHRGSNWGDAGASLGALGIDSHQQKPGRGRETRVAETEVSWGQNWAGETSVALSHTTWLVVFCHSSPRRLIRPDYWFFVPLITSWNFIFSCLPTFGPSIRLWAPQRKGPYNLVWRKPSTLRTCHWAGTLPTSPLPSNFSLFWL